MWQGVGQSPSGSRTTHELGASKGFPKFYGSGVCVNSPAIGRSKIGFVGNASVPHLPFFFPIPLSPRRRFTARRLSSALDRSPREQDYPGAPAPTDEDSITFKSFLESLDKGLVTKVDFLNGGNKAYAFVKKSGDGEATRIRVGEGYPDEQGKGWSSPLWVVRALNDRNVRETIMVEGRGGG